MASPSAAALRKAISSYLQDNANSPVANELRKIDHALGTSSAAPNSPGRQAAQAAGSGTQGNPPPQQDQGGAQPNSPGADMNNPSRPGGSGNTPPFQGVKRSDTAKKLAALRFKNLRKGGR